MDIRNMHAFSQLVLMNRPAARALLRGTPAVPELSGMVQFYPAGEGTLVVAEVMGLPGAVRVNGEKQGAGPFYAFHIHEPAEGGGLHYNPSGAPHPLHAGDLPPLPGSQGYAYLSVYTGRFAPEQVVGRVAVIHQNPDDFHTQPAGNPGAVLALGEIRAV